ncbi:hypothetical protein N2152v2_007447 [Parachlorella kessleri]
MATPFGGGDLAGGGALAKAAEVFRKYDKDGSGELDKEELVSALTDLGVLEDLGAKNAGKVLQQQMREADVNGDGKISWKEFSEYFSRMAQLKAAELRAGRIKGGRGKVVVPNELFSDACIKAAFNHYTSFGTARCLGDKAAAARQMSSQQWKRMLEVTGLLESIGGVAGGHAAADIIFARSRSTGATKLRFQSFLQALVNLEQESGISLHQIVATVESSLKKKPPTAAPSPSPEKTKNKARPATSPAVLAGKSGARSISPSYDVDSPTIQARPFRAIAAHASYDKTAEDYGSRSERMPAMQAAALPVGAGAHLLSRVGHIQQLLDAAAPSMAPALHQHGSNPRTDVGNSGVQAQAVMPVEVMQVFIKELMAQTRQQATQETARKLQSPTGGFCKEVAQGAQEPQQQPDGLGCKGEEYSMVVDNQEFGREEAVGAGALDGHKEETSEGAPRSLTPLEANTLKSDLWRILDQRCSATEASCAAIMASRAQATELGAQALRLGVAALQEEAGKLAASEQQHLSVAMRAFETRADQLQAQVDALAKILEDSCMPTQALQEAGHVREECMRRVAEAEERMAAREKKMGEALLQMARRVAELDGRLRNAGLS